MRQHNLRCQRCERRNRRKIHRIPRRHDSRCRVGKRRRRQRHNRHWRKRQNGDHLGNAQRAAATASEIHTRVERSKDQVFSDQARSADFLRRRRFWLLVTGCEGRDQNIRSQSHHGCSLGPERISHCLRHGERKDLNLQQR